MPHGKDPKLEKIVRKQATGKQTGRLKDKGPPKGITERRADTRSPRMKSLQKAIDKFGRGGGFKKLGFGALMSELADQAASGKVPPQVQEIFDAADAKAATRRKK